MEGFGVSQISKEDWRGFEKLVFQTLLALFHLTCEEQNRLTQSSNDGGFDGIFFIPTDDSENAPKLRAIMEAKLRGNIDRDLPLQDFSKSMIIAINCAARLLVVASNLRLSNTTIRILEEFSRNTGLEIQYLSIKTLYKQLLQNPGLAADAPPSLQDLLEKSYSTYAKTDQNESALQKIAVTGCLQTVPEPIQLFSSTRQAACENIIRLLKLDGGLFTVEGDAGIGKSYFVTALCQRLEPLDYKVIKIDLKNCSTSRILFIELVKALWCLPQEILQAIEEHDFAQAISWVGDETLDQSVKDAVIIAFQKGTESYIKHTDIFHYYLIEYLIQLYSQVQKRRGHILCFTNLNYAQGDLIEFLLQFLKRFDRGVRVILELRTSVYIDDMISDEDWEAYLAQIQRLPSVRYRCKLAALSELEYQHYINSHLGSVHIGLQETRKILEKSGNTLLLINAFLTFLKGNGFLEIPESLRPDYIVEMPVDLGQQLIPTLVDFLSRKGPFFSGLFFLTDLFQGEVPLVWVETILGDQRNDLDYLLRHTDIYSLSDRCLCVSHTLYLDYFSTRQYIAVTYQQTLAKQLLAATGDSPPFSTQEENTIFQIRLHEILNHHEQVAQQSLSFGIYLRQYGQYSLSQKYIKLADEKLSFLARKGNGKPLQHLTTVLTLLENELYLQALGRDELSKKLEFLEGLFQEHVAAIGQGSLEKELKIRYDLIKMRLYHYWGEYSRSFQTIEKAVMELKPDIDPNLVGRVWLEYAIATKEMYSINRCLQVFRQGRKRCPQDVGLLFSNYTHMSEKYSTSNAKIAMRCLQLIEPLKTSLPLSSVIHHEINVATMRMYLGNYQQALVEGTEIVRRANQTGLKNEEARCSNLLGCLALIQNDLAQAKRHLRHGDSLIPENKHVTVLWPILSNLLSVQLAEAQWEEAFHTAKRCSNIFQQSYTNRINHLYVANQKYPKLFIGLLLLIQSLILLDRQGGYGKECADLRETLLKTFSLAALKEYHDRLLQGEPLDHILQNTPFYQLGKIVIKS